MELFFPRGKYVRRRLSREARKDLTWWRELLSANSDVERLFLPVARKQFSLWTDAASLKGIGGYFIAGDTRELDPVTIHPSQAFMMSLP